MTEKNLSALEILALNDLPQDARINRMAALIRRHQWVNLSKPRLREIKACIEKFCEPRGMKTALIKILKWEIMRQHRIASNRYIKRTFYANVALDTRTGAYDPVAFKVAKFAYATVNARWEALTLARIAPVLRKNDADRRRAFRNNVTPPDRIVPCATWELSRSSAEAAGKVNGVYLMTTSPSFVRTSQGNRSFNHNVGFLLVALKLREEVKAIQIPATACSSLAEAVDSLKTSHVVKAEERGDVVQIDWERETWLVRSPRRKKWRELPFKKHTRDRKKKVEEQ